MKQYKELVHNILNEGQTRDDRTGTGTRSIFGTQTRYNLQDGFPILTTKKVNFKAVVAELLWFLSGSTNIKDLDAKIWDEWADDNGDLGPIYGHQWRNWGGNTNTNVGWRGHDQIAEAIDTIKTNPMSRRIIVSAWNPTDIPDMALPPCHLMFQFYVRKEPLGDYLDCQMYQRSADVALGVPFNIASYALLTRLIASECRLLPGELVHTIGDAHAYMNHVTGLLEQMERKPRPLPFVGIPFGKPVNEITPDDIELTGYDPHPPIKFEVSV
jgi:thymidylate synthase